MMDPPATVVKPFKYNSSQQQPMFGVLEPPPHYNMRSSSNIPTTFEDISFSSYLIKPKEPPVHKPPVNTAVIDDTEISIFDAQKYFSENNDPKYTMKTQNQQENNPSHDLSSSNPRLSSVSSADGYGRNFRTRSFHATPTASSEASWNSQTGLLANPPGSVGVSLRNFPSHNNKRSSASKKWSFGRKCCCTGKKSVQVKEVVTSDSSEHVSTESYNNNGNKTSILCTKRDSHHKLPDNNNMMGIHQQTAVLAPQPLRPLSPEDSFQVGDAPRQRRISASGRPFVDGAGGFSFPILNTSTQPAKKGITIAKPPITNNILEDPPRDSLEVFQPVASGPPSMDNPANALPNFNPGSPIVRDDDMGSDASSDLFEIESFSTQTTSYPMYRRRDSLEDEAPTFNARRFATANGIHLGGRRSVDDEPPTPSVAATECYAPSEVSIDWSVTTAEGFDRASVSNFSISASEVGSAAFLRRRLQEEVDGAGKRKGLLMMSCRQEKAVSVGPQPVKCEGGPPAFPMHVGSRPPRAATKLPLGNDHSARLSLAFAA